MFLRISLLEISVGSIKYEKVNKKSGKKATNDYKIYILHDLTHVAEQTQVNNSRQFFKFLLVRPRLNTYHLTFKNDIFGIASSCVSGGKKCLFFGNFGMLCFLETPVLRLALLPYYRRIHLNLNLYLTNSSKFKSILVSF